MNTYDGTLTLARDVTLDGLQRLSEVAAHIDQNYFSTTLYSRDGVVYLDYSVETDLLADLNLTEDVLGCWVWETVARVLIEFLLGETNAHDQGSAGDLD